MSLTRADLGQKVYEALSLLFTRYSVPARQVPLAELVDSRQRHDEAVLALQELSGLRIGTPPSGASDDPQRVVSGLSVLTGDIKRFVTPLMKGRDYTIRIPSKPVKARNSVSYKHYDILAFVDSANKVLYFAMNDQGQYILSDSAYWVIL